jgi:hypothetical protein
VPYSFRPLLVASCRAADTITGCKSSFPEPIRREPAVGLAGVATRGSFREGSRNSTTKPRDVMISPRPKAPHLMVAIDGVFVPLSSRLTPAHHLQWNQVGLGNRFETNSSLFPHPTREPILGGPVSRRQFVRTAHHLVPCLHKCTTTNGAKKRSLDGSAGVHGTVGLQGRKGPTAAASMGHDETRDANFGSVPNVRPFHRPRQDA